jgi:two-component system sensor histidine kinase RegB
MARPTASHVVLPWLIRLRWVSLAALAAAGWAAEALWRVSLPALAIVLLLAMAITNAALTVHLRAPAPRRGVIGAVLMLDVALLTGVLYLVGGPLNPFSIIYLVGVTLAAVALGHRWALAIALASNAAYALTFFYSRPLEFSDAAFSSRVLTLHLSGMWVALAAASGLIAYFVSRVSEALEKREQELTEARAAAARSDRLTALLTLGAGAAHELATPLSTISTAATELERQVASLDARAAANYVSMIRREVERCTTILDQLSGRASADSVHETEITLSRLVDDVRYRLGESLSCRLDVTLPQTTTSVHAPAEPLRQTLVALVRNAFDASRSDQRVALHIQHDTCVRVEVIDSGRGMSPDESAHAGEPFFTTKPRGSGLGLGLFLARAFADQMGGSLRWTSSPDAGTAVVLELPAR